MDYGITDLLDKVKGGTVFSSTQQSAGTLTQRIGSLAEQHKTLSTRARPMLLEMALNYRVAVYDAYINDILEAILIHIPEKLKSGKKTLTNQEALEFSEAGTLIEYLTNQQMVEFGYESVKDQVQWIFNAGRCTSRIRTALTRTCWPACPRQTSFGLLPLDSATTGIR